MALCAELLISAKLAKDETEAENKLTKALSSGRALEIFARMVAALGGPADFVEKHKDYLPAAAVVRPVFPVAAGFVATIQTRDIGMSIIGLKGGRVHPDQKLDYATGFSDFCQIGDYVDTQKPLAVIHAQSEEDFTRTAAEIRRAVAVSPDKPEIRSEIIEYIR